MSAWKEVVDQISRSEMKAPGLVRVQRGLLWLLVGTLAVGVGGRLEWIVPILLVEVIAIEAVAALMGLE